MTIAQLKALVQNDLDIVNQIIIDKIQSQIGLIENLAHHIVESGGKRIRPLVVLLTARACQYEGQEHFLMAAMVEFFHTATLLHDDVVDESTLRRGRQTANEIWGSKASILVGDYLFTQSVQMMTEANHWAIIRLMANTSHQMSCGEIKQLMNRHNPVISVEDYFDIIKSKTSLLFAASAAIGAMIANADAPLEQALYHYGLHLGNAFQLVDDALDYCSDTQTLGKNIGDDLADGKATLPLLCVLEKGSDHQRNIVLNSLKCGNLDDLDDILMAIVETDAIAYTKQFAQKEVDKALSALSSVPDSVYKNALYDLAQFAVDRQN